MRHILYTLLFISFFNETYGQNIDSLHKVLDTVKTPENEIKTIVMLSKYYRSNDPQQLIELLKRAYRTATDNKMMLELGKIHIEYGLLFANLALYDSSIIHQAKAEEIFLKIGDKKGLSDAYGNSGMAYKNKGMYDKAIEQHFKSLKIREEENDLQGKASTLNNIGVCYEELKEFREALRYYNLSMDVCKDLNMPYGIAILSNNIGVIHEQFGEYEEALKNFEEAHRIFTEMNHQYGIANALRGRGKSHQKVGNIEQAEKDLIQSLEIRTKLDDKHGIAQSKNTLANVYVQKKEYKRAISLYADAFDLATKIDAALIKVEALSGLKNTYKLLGDDSKALYYTELYMTFNDSLYALNKNKQITEIQTKYETDKKEQQIEILQKEQELSNLQIKKDSIIIYSVVGGLLLVVLFSILIYNRLQITRKQKVVIEDQKKLVEEKNKEITDSITYAKRIQEAILPSLDYIHESLSDVFILYKPKDVVAGDFYWLENYKDKTYIAAADCTGHGVPGAMVSVICSNALNKVLLEEGIENTGKLLDRVRELVVEQLAKGGEDVKDGMDISLCAIDKMNNKIEWSGANNPLWIIKNNAFEEYKADKQPIGKYENLKPFTSHSISLEKGDTVFLFTDGYADQFGGEKNKKYTYKKLREKLLDIQNKPLSEQKNILEKEFESWKGKSEQVDDVCMIGLKF